MSTEIAAVDEPPAELLAAQEAAEQSAVEDRRVAAEDATVAIDTAIFARMDREAAQQQEADEEEAAAATVAMAMPSALAALDDDEGDEEETAEATVAMAMPSALAALDDGDANNDDQTLVMDSLSRDQLRALASQEIKTIGRTDVQLSEQQTPLPGQPLHKPDIPFTDQPTPVPGRLPSASVGRPSPAAQTSQPQPTHAPPNNDPFSIGDAIAETIANVPTPLPQQAPDLSAMIDETLAEGSGRIQAIPEQAPKVDIEGVDSVPSLHDAQTTNKPSSGSGTGRFALVALVVLVVLVAVSGVAAYFLLPMFGIELPF
ncbi:MAG: hypothetical protein AAFX99_27690 [Myxococcota bacterium]